jgi:hypothetical protein
MNNCLAKGPANAGIRYSDSACTARPMDFSFGFFGNLLDTWSAYARLFKFFRPTRNHEKRSRCVRCTLHLPCPNGDWNHGNLLRTGEALEKLPGIYLASRLAVKVAGLRVGENVAPPPSSTKPRRQWVCWEQLPKQSSIKGKFAAYRFLTENRKLFRPEPDHRGGRHAL